MSPDGSVRRTLCVVAWMMRCKWGDSHVLVRSVALRHTPENAPVHTDWMWADRPGLAGPDARVLTTLRLPAPPLECGDRFEAVKIPDHRARYLWFEGEIGRGLGRVERVWEGVACRLDQGPDRFDIKLFAEKACVRIVGRARSCHDASSKTAIFDCDAQRLASFTPPALGPRIEPE